jgi:hypothetical protein
VSARRLASRSTARVGAALLALGSAACATPGVFERYVQAGLYEDAARTFEQDSTLWSRPETLLLAGRVFADPTQPTFDIGRAQQALERLVAAFPASPEAEQAGVLLPLLTQLERLEELEGELVALSGLTVKLDSLAARSDTLAASQLAAEQEAQALRRRIQRLEEELEQARLELERLKAIDLRRRPEERRQGGR